VSRVSVAAAGSDDTEASMTAIPTIDRIIFFSSRWLREG
jgi:hypothetical protein